MPKVTHKICTQRVKPDEDTIYLNKKIVELFMNSGRESIGSGLNFYFILEDNKESYNLLSKNNKV
jgi:hypothetical protein